MKIKDENVFIYLIDDDELHAKLLQSKFETSTNFQFFSFISGEEFLEDLQKNPIPKRYIPIVILDFFLNIDREKYKNGIEILKKIKQINPNIEVIMYSVNEDANVKAEAMQYGAVTYIRKNENAFLRILNNIKWLISKNQLDKKRRASKATLFFFILVIIGLTAAGLIIYFIFPDLLK